MLGVGDVLDRAVAVVVHVGHAVSSFYARCSYRGMAWGWGWMYGAIPLESDWHEDIG
jgi:hypothetical protein